MLLIQVLICGLIAIGVADTLANRAGPGGVSVILREWLSAPERAAWVQAAAACVYCYSFYGALLGALLAGVELPQVVGVWLAGFGLAVAFFHFVGE